TWMVDEGSRKNGRFRFTVRSDREGRFAFHHVEKDTAVELTARLGTLMTPRPVTVHSGEGDEPTLALDATRAVAMKGRVVDGDDRPIAGALVRIQVADRLSDGRISSGLPRSFQDCVVLATDADGWYQTPRELDPDEEYAAFASAPGKTTVRTAWTKTSGRTFPALKLAPDLTTKLATGRLLDLQGRPVEGGTVWSSLSGLRSTPSDAKGT